MWCILGTDGSMGWMKYVGRKRIAKKIASKMSKFPFDFSISVFRKKNALHNKIRLSPRMRRAARFYRGL